jgi:hypothetical protein
MRTIEQTRIEIESAFYTGTTFDFILISNPSIYKIELEELFKDKGLSYDEVEKSSFYIEHDPRNLKLIGDPIIERLLHKYLVEEYEYLYISDFICECTLIRFHTEKTCRLMVEGTVRIFSQSKDISPTILDVRNHFQYIIWSKEEKLSQIMNEQRLYL